jgi:subtilase family serine protease
MALHATRIAVLICSTTLLLSAQPDRITAAIDGRSASVLRGSVPIQAQARYDRGAVRSDFELGNITLLLRPSAAQQRALAQFLTELQDAASPNYHQWLTPEQYAERFAISQADLEQIAGWLRSQGFTVRYTARGRDFISFSGTAGQVRSALRTEVHRYQVGAVTHFANATDVSLPAALMPMVAGVMGLHDFHPKAPRRQALPNFNGGDGSHFLLPDDFATVYNLAPLYQYGYTGSGQSIAIVGQSDIDPEDIAAFRDLVGLPPTHIKVIPTGAYPGFNPDIIEADADLEWAGAVARDSQLIYVFSDDADYSAYYAIDNNLAPVISESFGLCEYHAASFGTGVYFAQQEAQKGNAMGITWMVSSGDSGPAGCDYDGTTASLGLNVSLPASIPEVTAVGGTEFNEGSGTYWNAANGIYFGSAMSYIPEMAWNDTPASVGLGAAISASGGGPSAAYLKPAWQAGPGVPNDGARDVPDVSLAASNGHDPYVIVSLGEVIAVGGTSLAAPSFAGVVSVLNQYLVQNNVQSKAGVGNMNPKLYAMAAAGTPGVFHDVTAGNSMVPCADTTPNCLTGQFGYMAGPGYDMVTGLGSVDVYKLITAWGGIPVNATSTVLTANPGVIEGSGSSVLTAVVKAASGTRSPTGTVSFMVGQNLVGVGTLSGSGGSAAATITISGSQLLPGNNTVTANYSGSPIFSASSSSSTVNLGVPSTNSAVTVTVTPDPVFQHAPDASGATFNFTIQLTETAGVATTVNGFSFSGVSYAASVATFFGSSTLAPHGTLTANLKANNVPVPSTVVLGFTGRDASGVVWTRQISVPFLPAQ